MLFWNTKECELLKYLECHLTLLFCEYKMAGGQGENSKYLEVTLYGGFWALVFREGG